MSKGGFVKLDRGIFKNFLWNEAREFSKAEAWIDLIQLARFEASTEVINGKVIELQRGEIPASRRYLELRWSWGSTKVSNFLKTLAQMKMINQRQTGGQTIISLVKYSIYNDTQTTDKPQSEPQTNQTQTSDKPEANQNKEYKEVKESKEDNILLGKESKVENQDFLSSQDNSNPKLPEEPEEGKEKSSAKKESEKFFSKRDFKKRLIELGAEEIHIDDWFKVRDKKKASYTETALNGLINECKKYSFLVKDAVRICAERSWQGFKYSWLDEKQKNNGQSNNQSSKTGTGNVRNGNDKVSGTTEIIGGARYTEFT
ncbi:hypothetical protein [Elizabethkingia anophelis]|uniref:Uncharacterized protein n=1 Tax=Elizabethkingia anophelis TaxID=1117645 RepID=A0A494JCI9_9FLAO|nr:hypothetical protein [Elizabethkingia anophelis]AQX52450.1 hypothetical protein AYC66_17975 [Elizabethkingia anophelis]MDV3888483.1 hypothetical protein [Elizabethkingia anophelis]OPB52785.1 hypothetical protein BAY09_18075 [Elizabethkingia anophelis]RBA33159.1 hypothetical protein DSC50_12885 [Elizabethkingia anophelis]